MDETAWHRLVEGEGEEAHQVEAAIRTHPFARHQTGQGERSASTLAALALIAAAATPTAASFPAAFALGWCCRGCGGGHLGGGDKRDVW